MPALLLVRERIVSEEEFHESDDVLLEKIEQYKKRPVCILQKRQLKDTLMMMPANATEFCSRGLQVVHSSCTHLQLRHTKRKIEKKVCSEFHLKHLISLVKVKESLKDGQTI
nr:MAG: hypothetical protein CM15mV30_0290 [uncultured marine virus]